MCGNIFGTAGNEARGVMDFLISQCGVKTEHDYIGIFIGQFYPGEPEIVCQPLVAEQIDAFARPVFFEKIYCDMRGDNHSFFIHGKSHFFKLFPA